MNDFSITMQLSPKEYAKAILVGFYKKTWYIFTTTIGLFLFIIFGLGYLKVIHYFSNTSLFDVLVALALSLLPIILTAIALIQVRTSSVFTVISTFTFGETGITIQTKTFKSELQWSHIIKQKKLGIYLILYHSKGMGNFVDKRKLTIDQIEFIKMKVAEQKPV